MWTNDKCRRKAGSIFISFPSINWSPKMVLPLLYSAMSMSPEDISHLLTTDCNRRHTGIHS